MPVKKKMLLESVDAIFTSLFLWYARIDWVGKEMHLQQIFVIADRVRLVKYECNNTIMERLIEQYLKSHGVQAHGKLSVAFYLF